MEVEIILVVIFKDDFAIWNRMLTASEAADLANRSVIQILYF